MLNACRIVFRWCLVIARVPKNCCCKSSGSKDCSGVIPFIKSTFSAFLKTFVHGIPCSWIISVFVRIQSFLHLVFERWSRSGSVQTRLHSSPCSAVVRHLEIFEALLQIVFKCVFHSILSNFHYAFRSDRDSSVSRLVVLLYILKFLFQNLLQIHFCLSQIRF